LNTNYHALGISKGVTLIRAKRVLRMDHELSEIIFFEHELDEFHESHAVVRLVRGFMFVPGGHY